LGIKWCVGVGYLLAFGISWETHELV